MAVETFTWIPSYGSSKKLRTRVRKTQYGDGYEQVLLDGINAKWQEWDVSFRVTTAQANEIDDFLQRHVGGVAFMWAPPGQTQELAFKIEGDPSRQYNAFNDETIHALFVQKFGAVKQ